MATKSFVNVRFDMVQKTGIFCRISPDILDRFSQSFYRERALFVSMIDLKFLFQYLEGRCHGNQIICERQVQTAKKLAYFVKYFRIYWTYFRNLCTI